jgi:hypothetical protein
VFSGLLVSTLLSLLVVPAVYRIVKGITGTGTGSAAAAGTAEASSPSS